MADIRITLRNLTETWSRPAGARHTFRLSRLQAQLLEMEDLHFHHDSAVMLPDHSPADAIDEKSGSAITGLAVIRVCYLHAAANPDQKLLCAGHTDRSGGTDYNKKLSDLRTANVRAVMMGERDEWTGVCIKKHVVKDYQLILKWIANVRYWPECDPGQVDGDHGGGTNKALRAFKKRHNAAYGTSLADSAAVDKPTWEAFFHMYMVGLADLVQTDEEGLKEKRKALQWQSPSHVGCGEWHPVTAELAVNYRNASDRRVELLFFDPGEEPDLSLCHPSPTSCKPEECELYGKNIYVIVPIDVPANAKAALRITEVRGLYKPGHNDPADVSAGTAKRSGYLVGYKSDDDLGRIFINQIPRADASVDWEAIKKKNKQFIELVATIDVAEGTIPPDAKVVWEWSDPDDPSDIDMRDDAAEDVDPGDFDKGKRIGNTADDNVGHCDHPKSGAAKEPTFEQIGPYKLALDAAGTRRCFTLISGGKSEVRLHCTDAGGDNYRIQATVQPATGLVVTAGDKTGTMTMWKRIDVEHRRMKDAEPIPAKEIAPFFEKQFVQMDVADEQPTKSNAPYVSPTDDGSDYTSFVDKEFKKKKKPGWFFVCSAREASAPAGKARKSLYEGPATLIEESRPLHAPTGCENLSSPPKFESVVVPVVLTEAPFAVAFFEGGKQIVWFADKLETDTPKKGQSKIHLDGIDFQSDFEPADGSIKKAYERRGFYFPRFRYRWPEKVWEKKGYGFPDEVLVNVVSHGASSTGGISPSVTDGKGCDFFAGRTVIFTRHPSYTKPAGADAVVEGIWAAGDVAEVTVEGTKVSYTVTAKDVAPPAGVADPAAYVRGQVGQGIEKAVNGDATLSKKFAARASFGKVRVFHLKTGVAGNGTPISAAPDAISKKPGTLKVSSDTMQGGGFDEESKIKIVHTITHEFGHAFGYPHKCGYNTFEKTPGTSCCMNYFHSWLYKLGTHRDPAGREVERFGPGKEGANFCALHTRGIRLGRLEDNPVLWSW
jgi:hypothetical protein